MMTHGSLARIADCFMLRNRASLSRRAFARSARIRSERDLPDISNPRRRPNEPHSRAKHADTSAMAGLGAAACLLLIFPDHARAQAAPIIYKGAQPNNSPSEPSPGRSAESSTPNSRIVPDDPSLTDGPYGNSTPDAQGSAYGRQYPEATVAKPVASPFTSPSDRPATANNAPIPLNERATQYDLPSQIRAPAQSPASLGAVAQGTQDASIRPIPPMDVRTDIVQPGDTLFAIANRNQTPIRAIIEANALMAPFALAPGQSLRIPPPRQHVVEPGETLYSVSRRFNIDLRSLALLNRLQKPWMLAQGQTIILPALARDGQMDGPPANGSPNDGSGVGANENRDPPRAPPSIARGAPATTGPIPLGVPAPQAASDPAGLPATNPTKSPVPPDTAPASVAAPVRFIWPIEGSIVQNFGPQSTGQRIDGIRVKTNSQSAVHAAAAGTVVYAGEDLPGFGKLLLIKHAGGWVTAYAQVGRFEVGEGESVTQGQTIAQTAAIQDKTAAGNEAQKTAILHFEVRNMKGRPVDPRSVLPQFRERG